MTNSNIKKPTPGTEILLRAYQIVNQDRQNTYGHPEDDYTSVIKIYEAVTGIRLNINQALLFMVSVKLARLRTNLEQGNLHYDTLLDTIGYLTCINMVHQRERATDDDNAKGKKKEANPRSGNKANRKRNKKTR